MMSELNSFKGDLHAVSLFINTPLYMPSGSAKAENENPEEAPQLNIAGANRKGVLFVQRSDKETEGAAAEMFNNMLVNGLKMEADDVAMVRIPGNSSCSFRQLKAQLHFQKLILWNLSPADIGLKLPAEKYKLLNYDEHMILFADSLEKIAADMQLKKVLWQQLQLMFAR